MGNRTEETWFASPVGGFYRLTVYLFGGGKVQNLTTLTGLVIEELVAFRGNVTGEGGARLEGAVVTLTNLRTNATASDTVEAGAYAISVVYPTWFRAGDPLRLEVAAGDRRGGIDFLAPEPFNGTIAQDLRLEAGGLGPWYAALLLGVLAAVGFVLALHFRRRYMRFKRIP